MMPFLIFTPYLLIILGVCLVVFGVRPRMLAWVTIMLGGLSSLVFALVLFREDPSSEWGTVSIAIAPFLLIMANVVKDLSHPRINDVSTDVERPPEFVAACHLSPNQGRDLSFPNQFGPVILKNYQDVKPLHLNKPIGDAMEGIHQLMDERSGWTIIGVDPDKGTIEAEVSTSFLRFVDDVIVRVEQIDQTTRVDMRSKSREGLVDGGYNARRIKAFLQDLSRQSGEQVAEQGVDNG
ncbi:MAG: DUF1499 domain-containing protein [Pseudomonadota bacterium]